MVNVLRSAVMALSVLVLVGCGDSSTAPEVNEPTYESIAGSYAGPVAGVAGEVVLDGQIAFTLGQTRGNLSGSYSISGTLSDGVSTAQIQGTGSLDGTVQSGNNPSVGITVTPGSCPNQTAAFSGSYDSTNRRLTIAGPIEIFRDDCSVALTYQTTLVLTR